MLEPVNIVTLREVRPVMSSTTFRPGEGADDNSLRNIEKGLEFEGLHEIRIKDPPFVLHRDGRGATGQRSERCACSRHGFMSPNEAKIEAHQLTEVFPNLPGSNRPLFCQQALDATLFGRKLVCCECPWRDSSSILSGPNSGAPTKHNRLKK